MNVLNYIKINYVKYDCHFISLGQKDSKTNKLVSGVSVE